MATAKTVPAGDDNAAPEVPVLVDEKPAVKIVAGAEDTGGRKLIRTRFPNDLFQVDKDTAITGEFQEFGVKAAAEIVAAGRRQEVDLVVTDANQKEN